MVTGATMASQSKDERIIEATSTPALARSET